MSSMDQSLRVNLSSGNTVQVGIGLCLLSMFIFAAQDGITKTLVKDIPVGQLVMIRYWFFLLFALCYSACNGGLKNTLRSAHPWLQGWRSVLAVLEIVLFGYALKYLGLAETHAIYAVFPLLTLGLAWLFLRERLTLKQSLAALIGFIGTLLILRPGTGVFSLAGLLPLVCALMFALFSIITRKISQQDAFATNTLFMGLWGAIASTVIGVPQWITPSPAQWGMIAVLCMTGISAQLLFLQALKFSPAVTLQPFNYTLLVFAAAIGVMVFGETLNGWLVAGAALVVIGGMLSFRGTSRHP